MNKLPKSKDENIVVQEIGKEILIYDLIINKAYCLNETSAIIWQHCDGKTSFEALKRKYHFTDELIYFALDELREQNLIDGAMSNFFGNFSRREIIKRVGLASMITLPVITGLVAPRTTEAQSCGATRETCTDPGNLTQSDCCSGLICDAARCIPCSSRGNIFSGCSGPCTLAQCNNSGIARNLCCNTTDDPIISGNQCLCP